MQPKLTGTKFEHSEPCRVLVVYEDAASQKNALELADHLRVRFGAELEIDFSWWNFKFLGNPEIAESARQAALLADILVFSMHAGSQLPAAVKHWVETWLPHRSSQTGALALLMEPLYDRNLWVNPADTYLNQVARRGELDYLFLTEPVITESVSRIPIPARTTPFPIIPQSFRASSYSPGALDWGINE